MARRFDCPLPDYAGAWVELPDKWLGKHAARRDEAISASAKYDSPTLMRFAVSMALLEDWSMPGFDGNPEKWDFTLLDLPLIAWVSAVVMDDFNRCFVVPKA